MKAAIRKAERLVWIALFIFLGAISDGRSPSGASITVNENAVVFAAQLIQEGHFVADGKGAWRDTDLRLMRKMSLFACTDFPSTRSGTSAWMNDIPRIRSVGTSFPTAISQTSTGAVSSRRGAEPLSSNITRSKIPPCG
jgi:hypothetical protein